jgi:hypothetical protein
MRHGELAAGDKVIWLHTPPGGYGYTLPIPATVVQVKRRVQVEVACTCGGTKRRWVSADNLRPATEPVRETTADSARNA